MILWLIPISTNTLLSLSLIFIWVTETPPNIDVKQLMELKDHLGCLFV